MAEAKKKRVLKKTETVREKASKKELPKKPQRLSKATAVVKKPLRTARRIGAKEYHPIKLPDNKIGRVLTQKRKVTPNFFRDAWGELRQVSWPNRKETIKMTLAVFMFAIIFSILVGLLDFGLEKIFRELLVD